jgi:hypothetical protein
MSGGTRRPSTRRGLVEGRADAIPVLLVAIALLAGCASPGPSSTATGSGSSSQPPASSGAPSAAPGETSVTRPGATPGVTTLPTDPPTSPTTGWTKLDMPASAPIARLQATRAGETSVALSTAFRLSSLTDTPVRTLADRLVVLPALKLRVTRVEGRNAVLSPAAPLRPAQIYRFELQRADGTAEAAWAVQAAWPLNVAHTLPGDSSSGVPRDTGIEVTFDQPGVRLTDVRKHVTMSPDVAGRWEQHDATFAFVPNKPLARNTLYTVTIRRGLPIAETGMKLEETQVIRFETTGAKVSAVHVTFTRPLFDAAPGERATLGLNLDSDNGSTKSLKKVGVKVHRLPGLTAAVDAWRRVDAAPDWTVRSSTTPVRTSALPEVLEGSVPVRHPTDDWRAWFRLPRTLPAGWYVVTVTDAGIARQAILQVTNVAAFSTATDTRSLVWVNDLATNRALSAAQVTMAGKRVGTTDAEGLLVTRTPAALLADAEEGVTSVAVVRSRGREMFLPLEADYYCRYCTSEGNDAWWNLLTLDRGQYRTSDTVNVWGVVRNRKSGAVPDAVNLTLAANTDGGFATQAAIAGKTLDPDPAGAYIANLSFSDLPPGEYVVTARVGKAEVASRTLLVGPIAKPAWKLALEVPKRAVLTGSSVTVNTEAAFFEGTPVAGAELRYSPENEDDTEGAAGAPIRSTTDAAGRATAGVPVRLGGNDSDDSQWSVQSIHVRPNDPEEGDIYADAPVVVFRSTALLDIEPTLKGTTLTITGAVHAVDFDRYDEDPGAELWDIDPRGAPLAGRRVEIGISEQTQVTRQTGTRYDFIAKRTVPVYESSTRTKVLPVQVATTGANGTFRLAVTVREGDRSYEVLGTHADPAGRTIKAQEFAWAREPRDDPGASLVRAGSDEGWGSYSVGDTVKVRFTHGIPNPEVSRYLFTVLARGLRSAAVQGSPTYSTRFTSALVPNAHIRAVRFTGTGYETGGEFGADLRVEDRALDVTLTADRDRYQPGDRVTVTVSTRSATGQPTSASVFVRAVDEKLFAMGAANMDDPLGELYQSTGSGLVATGWSHASPIGDDGDGKGDTTGGGGDREDFRDWLVARLVTTGADGRAIVTFDLSDDLTSWRVVGSAITTGSTAGVGHVHVPVGLPFFTEVVVAPEYLAVDRPAIRLRAYGSALRAGDPVRFTVTSGTVPLAAVTADSTAFEAVEVELPAMPVGTHRLRVTATTSGRTPALADSITRTFDVVKTRAIRSHVTSVPLTPGTTVGGGDGLTRVMLVDAGRGRVVPMLLEAAGAEPYRADTAIAAAMARDLLADGFGIPDSPGLPEPDLLAFQDYGGIGVMPYAGADLELSAMAALSGDRRVNRDALRQYFSDLPDVTEGRLPLTRELYLLLGRASLGDASIGEVTLAASRKDLTVAQQVTVALAALAVGDEPMARRLYGDILANHGERLGPWIRIKAQTAEATAVSTARLAIVAAALGDPIAADMDAEITAHPPKDTVLDLERVIAALRWAGRMAKADATAAVTIDGVRTVVTVTGDKPVQLDVTPAQRKTLRIDPVSGSVIVAARWDGPVAEGDLAAPAGLTVTRTVVPAGRIGPTDTVVVSFQVTLGPNADDGCWQMTDLAPSGLAPIATSGRWDEAEEEDTLVGATHERPWRVVGQRVDFCVSPDPKVPTQTLRYLARVVTSGTYRWEPAVLQSSIVPEQGVVLPPLEVMIGGLGS